MGEYGKREYEALHTVLKTAGFKKMWFLTIFDSKYL